ncbi:MAG: hypothetical protein KDB61_11830, partial [Planctomycetes bacterium]|nr:hypothetical protein [Planctomycetota bacterium]
MINLQKVVQQREEQTRWAAERAEMLGAQELQRALGSPAILGQVRAEHVFGWRGGRLVVPKEVGWLVAADMGEDLAQDPLVRDLVQRAHRAQGGEAGVLWRRALEDSGLGPDSQSRLRIQAAWFAHRQGNGEWCDSLLQEIPESAGVDVRASKLLLEAMRTRTIPANALQVFGHLEPERARALAR